MNSTIPNVPQLQQAWDLLGDDPAGAIKTADEYLQNNPTDPVGLLIKYLGYGNLEDWGKAIAVANARIRLQPNKASGYCERAEMHYRLGRYEAAIADAKHALGKEDAPVQGSIPHRLMALSYAAQGDKHNAVTAAENIPVSREDKWLPPFGPLPAGTKRQYIETMRRMADYVAAGGK